MNTLVCPTVRTDNLMIATDGSDGEVFRSGSVGFCEDSPHWRGIDSTFSESRFAANRRSGGRFVHRSVSVLR
jgi:hypothetical protein